MLLVPIGPLALMLTPTVVRRGRRRLAIHGSADPLQYITRALRVRRRRIKHENQRKSQDRPLYHFTLPCTTGPNTGSYVRCCIKHSGEGFCSCPYSTFIWWC